MKVFIVENQIDILKELEILLHPIEDVVVVGTSATISNSVEEIPKLQPDLVLMDIQLNDGLSFDILKKIETNFHIIFITAYNHYAIRAIKVGAMDYLLKPVDAEELYQAIDRLKRQSHKSITAQQKEQLLAHIEPERKVSSLMVKTADCIHFLDLDEVMYCRGEGNYTTFYTDDLQEITSSKPLREYRELLQNTDFIQTHQSYLVNTKFVRSYYLEGILILKKEIRIPVSHRKKEEVLEHLKAIL